MSGWNATKGGSTTDSKERSTRDSVGLRPWGG